VLLASSTDNLKESAMTARVQLPHIDRRTVDRPESDLVVAAGFGRECASGEHIVLDSCRGQVGPCRGQRGCPSQSVGTSRKESL
jgi:hypothetical protein